MSTKKTPSFNLNLRQLATIRDAIEWPVTCVSKPEVYSDVK